ncbi:hypothetical protein LSH36_137g01023 [Paralvinella palmiformis]|uniref:FANCL C-terminal domain-containing protein n=1 Tax=Paralvinella palmiformis TaxID=53620 RepID=A0AAD9NAN3_9ANNE|nr:hypothetical protein LSH36_137g01023 [Paralvinella palmiformis]
MVFSRHFSDLIVFYFQWLQSLPSFRQSFNVTFGECPYCSTPISVKTRR